MNDLIEEKPQHPPKRYPRLTAAQMERLCYEVRLYFAAMEWVRSGHQARAFVYQGAQLELFTDL